MNSNTMGGSKGSLASGQGSGAPGDTKGGRIATKGGVPKSSEKGARANGGSKMPSGGKSK